MINLSLLFIQEQAILLCRPLRSGISFIVPGSIAAAMQVSRRKNSARSASSRANTIRAFRWAWPNF